MRPWTALSFGALCLPLLCDAWGNLAHRTIALLAAKHFTPEASRYTIPLLGTDTIDVAAIWADAYKQLPSGRDTGSWHFVDAKDDPPHSCNVHHRRDCQPERKCILDAISNVTDILLDLDEPWTERQNALKYVLHLIGDLHCPLHVESLARGGNDIAVLYQGQKTNLHFVWDVLMPRDVAGSAQEDDVEAAKQWAERLYNSVNASPNGSAGYHKRLDSLKSSEASFDMTKNRAAYVLDWARDTNALVCSVVLPDGAEAIKDKELSGEYFDISKPMIEQQLFLSGIRLAFWINSIAEHGKKPTQEREEL
jgi:hypothetical protein